MDGEGSRSVYWTTKVTRSEVTRIITLQEEIVRRSEAIEQKIKRINGGLGKWFRGLVSRRLSSNIETS